MNAKLNSFILAMVLISFAGLSNAGEPEAPVAVKTDGLPPHVAAKVEQKAAEGMSALRRYVWITRAMHELDMRSLVRQEPATAIAAARNEKAEKVVTTSR